MCTFIKYVCSFIYAEAAVAEIYVQLKSSKNIYSADPFGINETQFFFVSNYLTKTKQQVSFFHQ